MEIRLKELIAVGASVTANCQPCLQYHVSKALQSGATNEEISQAIEIGKEVRKGAAFKLDKLAASLTETITPASTCADDGCSCD